MAVPVRKVRDHQEAAELVRALEISGQDLTSFCGRIGIDPRSLHCWRLNLRRRAPPPPTVRLVEVGAWTPPPAERSSASLLAVSGAPPSTYRLHVGAVVVEVDDHFRPDTLARLLQVVRAC